MAAARQNPKKTINSNRLNIHLLKSSSAPTLNLLRSGIQQFGSIPGEAHDGGWCHGSTIPQQPMTLLGSLSPVPVEARPGLKTDFARRSHPSTNRMSTPRHCQPLPVIPRIPGHAMITGSGGLTGDHRQIVSRVVGRGQLRSLLPFSGSRQPSARPSGIFRSTRSTRHKPSARWPYLSPDESSCPSSVWDNGHN